MTGIYIHEDTRTPDYWVSEIEGENGILVDLSDEFKDRYKEAVDNYDGIQAELELIYKGKVS